MPDVDRQSLSGSVVAAILLAAGSSMRLRRPKQLLEYRGRTLLRHAAEQALASGSRPVIVVLGAEEERCRQALTGLDVIIAVNPEWARGMGSSIRTGISALTAHAPDAEAAIMLLCDQPLVTAPFLNTLIARYAAAPGSTIAAHYAGEPGVPALFPRARFAELASLGDASGAKRLLRAAAAEVIAVPCPEAIVDVDTLADYEALSRPSTEPR